MIDPRGLTVIAATGLEADPLRRLCPQVRVIESGMALANIDPAQLGDAVISCGVAGGLSPALDTGAVLIPREVMRPDGQRVTCDVELQSAFAQSARRLGYDPIEAPMITSAAIVHGEQRGVLAQEGYAGVDMESGLLRASRIGVIRVVLDTPQHELSPVWLHPAKALMNPMNWPEAIWLARTAPRCATIAAHILANALSS